MRVERIDWDGLNPRGLAARLRALTPAVEDVSTDVAEIIAAVREGGDESLRDLAERFDEGSADSLRVDPEHVAAAPGLLEPELREALRVTARNVERVARTELEASGRAAAASLAEGQRVEVREEPVAAAGVYAPGGRAAYASSVIMCCVPARVAGVVRLVVATPPKNGRPSAVVLAACAIAGVDEVYAVGGAQAIAALAYGTESVPAVDVIAGPGNRFVTEAKRQVSGRVGIDGIAGPSELAIVTDGSTDPRLLALDVCAQAEHGDDSLLVIASVDAALLDMVGEIAEELSEARPSIAQAPLALVSTPGTEVALALVDALAPEHLQLAFAGADETVARARVAGCVFVGPGAATAFGDYAAGSNHVLPTAGAARFAGPLGPGAFRRRMSVVSLPATAAAQLAPHVAALAGAEGFPVHGESAEARA